MDFAETAVGANGANAVVQRVRKMSWMPCLCRLILTGVDCSDVLE